MANLYRVVCIGRNLRRVLGRESCPDGPPKQATR